MSLFRQIGVARAPLVAFSSMGVLWGAFAALIPDIKEMLRISDAQFGTLMLATPIAAVATMLLAPRWAPRIGRNILPIAVLALAVAFVMPGWFAVPGLFALAMVVVGGANGLLDVTMNARVSALEAERDMHLMNLNHAAYSFGYAGAAIATGLARSHGFLPWQVLGLAALIVGVLSVLAVERGDAVNGFSHTNRERKLRMGMIPIWGGLIALIAFMTENAAENWSALHIERTLGGTPGQGSFGPAVLALTAGVGRIVGQVFVAHVDESALMRWGAMIGAVGLALVGLAPNPAFAYGALVITGLGGSVLAPTAFATIGRLAGSTRRAHMIARASALGYLGYFFGPAALGFMSEALGLRFALVAMASVILLILWLFPRLLASGPVLHHGAPDAAQSGV